MWPVGLITKYGVSSPIVRNGTISGFYDGWIGGRKFPVDMAGKTPFYSGRECWKGLMASGRSKKNLRRVGMKGDNLIVLWGGKIRGNCVAMWKVFSAFFCKIFNGIKMYRMN